MSGAVLTEEEYAAAIDRLYETSLRAGMVAGLERLAVAFREAGYTVSGPHDLSGDEYRWYISVEGGGLPEQVDVAIEVAESVAYEGTTDGANVGLDIVAYSGRILGGLTPYNWTPDVWASLADDGAEIVDRLRMVAGADPADAVRLVDEFASEGSRPSNGATNGAEGRS